MRSRHIIVCTLLKCKRLYARIKNLIVWFPVIFNDRQSDNNYIYIILRKKLSLMETEFLNSSIAINSKARANELRECVEIIDKLLEDDYYIKAASQGEVNHLFYNMAKHIGSWFR